MLFSRICIEIDTDTDDDNEDVELEKKLYEYDDEIENDVIECDSKINDFEGKEFYTPIVGKKKLNNANHLSFVVFYGSPKGVRPKRQSRLLRLLDEIRVELEDQHKSIDGLYSVKLVRNAIDELFLPSSPVQTRSNLSRRGINVVDISCPLCNEGVEEAAHIFLRCPLARGVLLRICRWWNVGYQDCESFSEWYIWFASVRLPSKSKWLLEGIPEYYIGKYEDDEKLALFIAKMKERFNEDEKLMSLQNFQMVFPYHKNQRYKGIPQAIKKVFVQYLYHVKHPKAEAIEKAKISRMNMKWRTTRNSTDCGVFTMFHMENYIGDWICGLYKESKQQNEQLKSLRSKFAAKIILSDFNLLREEFMKLVQVFQQKNEEERKKAIDDAIANRNDREKIEEAPIANKDECQKIEEANIPFENS
ncbi:ulp1 protease family, C-terminal catalytic domain-containing protein [Tanacetum coccineum]